MLTLKSPKSGQVVEVYVRNNSRVIKGQQLLRLDDDVELKTKNHVDTTRQSLTAHQASLSVEIERQRKAAIQASIDANEVENSAALVAFEGTREEARIGQRTTLDVLTAAQKVVDSQTRRLQLRTKFDLLVWEYGHRRRAIELALAQLIDEEAFINIERERLVIRAPVAGAVTLYVRERSPTKLAGALASIQYEVQKMDGLNIMAPLDIFVVSLLVTEGERVAAGQPIIQLDQSRLERDISRQKKFKALLAIKAERLDPAYVDKLILPPLQAQVEGATSNVELFKTTFESDARSISYWRGNAVRRSPGRGFACSLSAGLCSSSR
jgi:multidrug efflux pump subunit AcrA (membrane-fusion protein)